jgi:hypothetical protein
MRRKQKQVPNLAQAVLPLGVDESMTGTKRRGGGRFQLDSPVHLHVGLDRLDQYLEGRGLGWVVRLRRELERVDYTPLVVGYDTVGRRPYHPRTILGLIVYGMLCRQWSLRELEVLAVRDMGAWWICGGLQPDHSTIGDFVQRHRDVLTEEFFVALVKSLVGRAKLPAGVVAGDGTVVQAATSQHRVLTLEAARAAAERARAGAERALDDEARQAAVAQAEEVVAVAQERTDRRAAKSRPSAAPCVAPSEPAAVIQPGKNGGHHPSYKPSTLVHDCGLIVAQHLHPSSETAVVEALLDQHLAVFGHEPLTALFDAGYHSCEVLQKVTERGIDMLCPAGKSTNRWEKQSGAKGYFSKNAFTYDPDHDVYRCPAGLRLHPSTAGIDRDGRAFQQYGGAPCTRCALRPQCTTSERGRSVIRYEGEEFKELMAQVLRHPAARKMFRRRGRIVERPFAELRGRQGLTRFHRRGVAGARVEFALHCIAFNLKWAIGRDAFICFRIVCAIGDTSDTRWFVTVFFLFLRPRGFRSVEASLR